MTSPVDSFKNNLFTQLKSYGDAVQGAFEQRIARPLLALKRDLSRSSSTTRTSSDRETLCPPEQPTFISYQESILASTPLEIIDIETSDTLKTLLDKFKSTFSPTTTKRRTSEDVSIDDVKKPTREHRHSSISALSNKTQRRNRLRHKSVSFAENTSYDNASSTTDPDPIVQLDQFIHTLADKGTTYPSSTFEEEEEDDDDETDFERHFHHAIRPRRMSIGNGRDLVYQDLSAEIVGYVLKHAIRAIEKEDEELLLAEKQKNEEDEEFIDLK